MTGYPLTPFRDGLRRARLTLVGESPAFDAAATMAELMAELVEGCYAKLAMTGEVYCDLHDADAIAEWRRLMRAKARADGFRIRTQVPRYAPGRVFAYALEEHWATGE